MKKLFSKLHFRSIFKTLAIMIALCFLYNIAYILTMFLNINAMLLQAIQVFLSLLSSVGFYWICCMIWKHKNFKFDSVLKVLIVQGVYILIVNGLLTPIFSRISATSGIALVFQLISAFCLILMIPIQLVIYYGICFEVDNLKEFVISIFKQHQKSILNWYCGLLILIIVLDTLAGGLFSILSGFDAHSLLTTSLYMGNPMMNWMLVLFIGTSFQATLAQMFTMLFINFLIGFGESVLELNFVSWIGEICHGDHKS